MPYGRYRERGAVGYVTLNRVSITRSSVMQNPFVYGEVVPSEAFVNRIDELDRLVGDLTAAQKIFLISPRRYGKSSLIRQVLSAMARQGALTVEVTVSAFSSYVAFLEGYARALLAAETRWDRARSWLREAVQSAQAEVRVSGSRRAGGLEVSFPTVRSDRDVSRLAEEVFALPARLADARRRRVVVALDEFQAIGGFNGGSVEHTMRAAVQLQRAVGYVFAGSEPSLMERMLAPKRPFYKAGPVMRLGKIDEREFASFIEEGFMDSGIRAEKGLGEAIVELAGNLPYDVQRLAHETWDEVRQVARRRATLEDLHRALGRLLAEQHVMFEGIWQRLTLGQRATLRAVVLEQGRELLAADTRSRYRLGGASTVQSALAALTRNDLITRDVDRYVVVDSLMREWVARRTF